MEFNYKAQKSEVSKIKVLEVSSSDCLGCLSFEKPYSFELSIKRFCKSNVKI